MGGSEGYDAPYIGYQIMYANRYLLSSNATFNSVCLWGVQCVFMGGGKLIAISVNYIIILISPEPLPIALLNKLETNIFSADKIDL